MEKLDNWIFATLSKFVIRWVKKQKYQKHKYDFFISLAGWEIAWWVGELAFSWWKYHSEGIVVPILYSLMMVTVIGFEFVKMNDLKEMKEFYDPLWERRKNPMVYNMVKEVTETLFRDSKKPRIFTLRMSIIFLVVMSWLNPLLTPIYVFLILFQYQNYIFDFDEPQKKEKKETDSVTDIVMNAWKSLVGTLAPVKG